MAVEEKKEVSQEVLQEIVNYLQGKPYLEVYQLINKIIKEVNNGNG